MRALYFDKDITGHHLEYIHHLYMGMAEQKDMQYTFIIPEDFQQERDKYHWPKADNIAFDFLSKEELDAAAGGNLLLSAWKNAKLVRKRVKAHQPDAVFLIDLMPFLPFILFFLPSKVKVSGIIYRIYLYTWKQKNWLGKAKSAIVFWLLAHAKATDRFFILNDTPATVYLNRLYKTTCFVSLPDPFNSIDYEPKNIKEELGIENDTRIFLHFGGLAKRKGTLTLLEAIKEIPLKEREKMALVFAGKVYPDIHDAFYPMVDELSKTIHINVFDYFCSNELIADLCYTTDFILVPYESKAQSSGAVSYAAYYSKPVIGPSKGLLGKIIRRNRLGIALKSITPQTLAKAMEEAIPYRVETNYKDKIRKELFVEKILFHDESLSKTKTKRV